MRLPNGMGARRGRNCTKNSLITQLNHTVMVIGYDERNNWIVKNSLGSSWADSGIGYFNSKHDCAMRRYVFRLNYSHRKLVGLLILVMALLIS